MAGISRSRWRKAWTDGVVAGATNRGRCALTVPALVRVFNRGVEFGKLNAESLLVRTLVGRRRPEPRKMTGRTARPFRTPKRRPEW